MLIVYAALYLAVGAILSGIYIAYNGRDGKELEIGDWFVIAFILFLWPILALMGFGTLIGVMFFGSK
jgi:hypothetical protein